MNQNYMDGVIARHAARVMLKMWQAKNPRPFHNETATLQVELADGRSSWGDDRKVMVGVQVQFELHKPAIAWYPLTVVEARELSEHLSAMADCVEHAEATTRLTNGGTA